MYFLDKLEITHRHARGPGGQHVNKSEKNFLVIFLFEKLSFD
jgi:protein subunit release factor B